MKRSRKSNELKRQFDSVIDEGYLTDKQKRAERRRIKKEISKTERAEGKRRFDDEEYDY